MPLFSHCPWNFSLGLVIGSGLSADSGLRMSYEYTFSPHCQHCKHCKHSQMMTAISLIHGHCCPGFSPPSHANVQDCSHLNPSGQTGLHLLVCRLAPRLLHTRSAEEGKEQRQLEYPAAPRSAFISKKLSSKLAQQLKVCAQTHRGSWALFAL